MKNTGNTYTAMLKDLLCPPKMSENQKRNVYFSTKAILALCHARIWWCHMHTLLIPFLMHCYGKQSSTPAQTNVWFMFSNSLLNEIQIKSQQLNKRTRKIQLYVPLSLKYSDLILTRKQKIWTLLHQTITSYSTHITLKPSMAIIPILA